jgi:hypothetical protein
MTSDNGPAKAQPTPKAASAPSEAAAKPKASEGAAKPKESEGVAKPEAKPEGSTPSSYSRGEGQKPVTNAYKENWNLIYGKKKKKKPSR